MLVSCIMPTRGRREMAKFALECFRVQTYPNRELIVVDDRDDPSFPQGIADEQVRYEVLPRRLMIGAKRNIAIARASGDVICHWDSDDYSAPERIAEQMRFMQDTGAEFVAFNGMTFVDLDRAEAWRLSEYDRGIGTSFCYTRDVWQSFPFLADVEMGEDFHFSNKHRSELKTCDAAELMIATTHRGNTSYRTYSPLHWNRVEWPQFGPWVLA